MGSYNSTVNNTLERLENIADLQEQTMNALITQKTNQRCFNGKVQIRL